MSTEKKKEQQLLEDVTAQTAAPASLSTAGLNSGTEVMWLPSLQSSAPTARRD